MSVRKRRWVMRKGEHKEAWIVNYTDSAGTRRLKTFPRKKAADEFAATATVQVRECTHVADAASVTVAKAGALWISGAVAAGLERTTVDQYRQHMKFHIEPFLGRTLYRASACLPSEPLKTIFGPKDGRPQWSSGR
jgi:integrase